MSTHRVSVRPLPAWVDARRLLGEGDWTFTPGEATTSLPTHLAADLAARLRGLGLDGEPLIADFTPPLPRAAVRAARTEDARRRRDTSPGFTRTGTRLDEEGRFSLTPERTALWLGRQANGARVLDAGCGAGGNSIGFARAGCPVIAIERDPDRLRDARHNAACYEVADRIRFLQGDAVQAMQTCEADLLFVDPPWGAWDKVRTTLDDLPLLAAALQVRDRFREVWAKVPPSFDTRTVRPADATAVFGHAPGDQRRIKLVWLRFATA